jgi:hypothetical protein
MAKKTTMSQRMLVTGLFAVTTAQAAVKANRLKKINKIVVILMMLAALSF